ncbi:hypothetical protein [Streptomyces sp. Act143]|uniref:hypothetical protein n=1 Tax=Streptomyces sp. Act143 TaxID=2200760 RepID=UPI0035C06779
MDGAWRPRSCNAGADLPELPDPLSALTSPVVAHGHPPRSRGERALVCRPRVSGRAVVDRGAPVALGASPLRIEIAH